MTWSFFPIFMFKNILLTCFHPETVCVKLPIGMWHLYHMYLFVYGICIHVIHAIFFKFYFIMSMRECGNIIMNFIYSNSNFFALQKKVVFHEKNHPKLTYLKMKMKSNYKRLDRYRVDFGKNSSLSVQCPFWERDLNFNCYRA